MGWDARRTTAGLCVLAVWPGLCTAILGCAHAPPARFADVGGPGRLVQGDFEVSAAGYPAGFGGKDELLVAVSPTIAAAPADWMSIELGGEFARGLALWDLGQLGMRFTPFGRVRELEPGEEPASVLGLFDIEVGGGVGRTASGGMLKDSGGALAAGGYVGLGSGVAVDWFTWYARGRGQFCADGLGNMTLWGQLLTGAEFMIADHLALWASGGFVMDLNIGFNSTVPPLIGGQWGGGLALHFSMLGE